MHGPMHVKFINSILFDYKKHNQEHLISAILEVATFVLRYYVW